MKKLMKDLINPVIVVFFVLILVSCQKNLTKSPAPTPLPTQILTPRPPNLVTWKESLRSNLKKEDVLFFLNTYEIESTGVIPKFDEAEIKDGGLSSLDTVFYVTKTVPPYTPGRVEDLIRDKNGLLIQMKIKFDLEDRTYKLLYTLEDYARYLQREDSRKNPRVVVSPINDSGSFIMGEDAQLFFKGKESPVKAKIIGHDDDRLLVKDTRKVTPIVVKEQAKGTNGTYSSGTAPVSSPKVEKRSNEPTPSASPYAPTK